MSSRSKRIIGRRQIIKARPRTKAPGRLALAFDKIDRRYAELEHHPERDISPRDPVNKLHRLISSTPPASFSDALAKLRHAIRPDTGLPIGQNPSLISSLGQAFVYLNGHPVATADDTELMRRIARFDALYANWTKARELSEAAREDIDNDPECPADALPVDNEQFREWQAFRKSRGVDAIWSASSKLGPLTGKAVKEVFATRANTLAGVFAKLRIVSYAYGTGAIGSGDEDLESYQGNANWLVNAMADLAQLMGGAP